MNQKLQPGENGTITIAMRSISLILAAALAAAAVGCGHARPEVPAVEVVDHNEAISFETAHPEKAGYIISTNDELDISFLFEPQLSSRVRVRPDGGVALPIMGDVVVAGLTPAEVDSMLTQAYATYYKSPEITVNVTQFAPPSIYVLGEVRRAGDIQLRPGMTAVQALAMASGPTIESKLGNVVLLRRTGPGKAIAERLDLAGVMSGKHGAQDVLLAPNDILYVPPTFITKLDRFVNQFFSRMQPIPGLYLSGWEAFHAHRIYGVVRTTTPVNQ
jgi:protein involved in polysaccharide export with SLBB domain